MSIVKAPDMAFEAELEKAAALSLRPSQYIGWEIGSTASQILSRDQEIPQKRVALNWPAPYAAAMKDPVLLEAYEILAATPSISVERIFEPGEDLRNILAARGLAASRFSLESKSLPETFDYLASPEPGLSGAALAQNIMQSCGISSKLSGPRISLIPFSSGGKENYAPFGSVPGVQDRNSQPDRSFSYRVCLSRAGWARFLSHLEQIQLIKQVLRNAELPVRRTQGKNAKSRVSFGPAVSVGWNSEAEYFDMELFTFMDTSEIASRLSAVLPLGYGIVGLKRIPSHFPSLEESANQVVFHITARPEAAIDWTKLLEFSRSAKAGNAPELTVRKEKPGQKVDVINVADILKEAELAADGLDLTLGFGPKKNLKPEKILEAVLGLSQDAIKKDVFICRKSLALETGSGKLRPL